jgi:hypothetical protein
MYRFLAPAMLVAALVGCGSSGSLGGDGDGAVASGNDGAGIENAGDDAIAHNADDSAAVESANDGAAKEGDATGGGDAQLGGDALAGLDSGSSCPSKEPGAGTPCPVVGMLCTYGAGICCGGGYTCAASGTWQVLEATCACPAPRPDGGGGASPDGGTCPASCTTFTDCNSCPQKAFGGWSCNGGICQFMG